VFAVVINLPFKMTVDWLARLSHLLTLPYKPDGHRLLPV